LFDVVNTLYAILIANGDERSAQMAVAQAKNMSAGGKVRGVVNRHYLPSTVSSYLEHTEVDCYSGTYSLHLLKEALGGSTCSMGIREIQNAIALKFDRGEGAFAYAARVQRAFVEAEETAQSLNGLQHMLTYRENAFFLLIATMNQERFDNEEAFSQGDKTAMTKLNSLYLAHKLTDWSAVYKVLGEQAEHGHLLSRPGYVGMSNSGSGSGSGGGSGSGSGDRQDFSTKPDTQSFHHNKMMEYRKFLTAANVNVNNNLVRIVCNDGRSSCRIAVAADGQPVSFPAVLSSNNEARFAYDVLCRAIMKTINGKPNPKFNQDIANVPIKQPSNKTKEANAKEEAAKLKAEAEAKAEQKAAAKAAKKEKLEKEAAALRAEKATAKAKKEQERLAAYEARRQKEEESRTVLLTNVASKAAEDAVAKVAEKLEKSLKSSSSSSPWV
jgi:hypothetical protein